MLEHFWPTLAERGGTFGRDLDVLVFGQHPLLLIDTNLSGNSIGLSTKSYICPLQAKPLVTLATLIDDEGVEHFSTESMLN